MASQHRTSRRAKRQSSVPLQPLFIAFVVVFSCITIWFSSRIVSESPISLGVPAGRLPLNNPQPQVASVDQLKTGKLFNHENEDPIKVAHVISLITCQKASRVRGFLDALIILRHSIHKNSVHTAGSGSAYSYQMYAILHPDGGCLPHVPLLKRLGYIPLVRTTPVNISDITTNDWYKNHVEGENCCGSKEFIKLYAYTLTDYPVVVHWDLDVAVLKPMDDLFDAMIFDKDSDRGRRARERLHVQRKSRPLPDQIDAFYTRDVTSAQPWEKVQAIQGGFVVARPSMEHFEAYRSFILEANYTPGRGPKSGWGGMVCLGCLWMEMELILYAFS